MRMAMVHTVLRGTSTLRAWVLRSLLVALGFMPLLAIETGLRVIDGRNHEISFDPCIDPNGIGKLFERSGSDYRIRQDRLQLFAPASFASTKAADAKRIFCIGGSTTQGEPYQPASAFPKWLEVNLQIVDPSHRWEVINCGGLSYASYRMLPIVNEVLGYEPDLIILDCGHNEFLEERELSHWKDRWEGARRAENLLNQLKSVQLLNQFLNSKRLARSVRPKAHVQREVDALLDNQGGLEKYRRDQLQTDLVIESMRWNLQSMIDACQRSHVPVLLLVPTSNLEHCPPFKTELSSRIGTAQQAEVRHLWENAQLETDRGMDPGRILDALLSIDPEHADALYWRGKILLSQGCEDAAKQFLVRARDSDVCPLRASSRIRHAISALADQNRVWSFDVDAMFQSRSNNGIVGERWLIDHVHPRIEGHQLLAESLAEQLVSCKWLKTPPSDWGELRRHAYRMHLSTLGEDYYVRGKQRLEGLVLWTQGRAKKGLIYPNTLTTHGVVKISD